MYRRLVLCAALIFSSASSAFTYYNPKDQTLTIQQISKNGVVYNDVVVQVTGLKVLSAGSSQPTKETKCRENFFPIQFEKITLDMDAAKLLDLIGCGYNPQVERADDDSWALLTFESSGTVLEMIKVYINPNTRKVTIGPDGTTFKVKSGF